MPVAKVSKEFHHSLPTVFGEINDCRPLVSRSQCRPRVYNFPKSPPIDNLNATQVSDESHTDESMEQVTQYILPYPVGPE